MKILKIILLLTVALILSGCGQKKLTCDNETGLEVLHNLRNDSIMKLFETMPVVFNGNYTLSYDDIITNDYNKETGKVSCSCKEKVSNFLWSQPDAYMVCPVNYSVQYTSTQDIYVKTNIFDKNRPSDYFDIFNSGECTVFDENNQEVSGLDLIRLLGENSQGD